jgi:hypothetical protein
MIDRLPEIMLMIEPGTKKGETLRTPPADEIIAGGFDHRQTADARADRNADPLGATPLASRPASRMA